MRNHCQTVHPNPRCPLPIPTPEGCSDPAVRIPLFGSRCSDPAFGSRCSDPAVRILLFGSRCSDPALGRLKEVQRELRQVMGRHAPPLELGTLWRPFAEMGLAEAAVASGSAGPVEPVAEVAEEEEDDFYS